MTTTHRVAYSRQEAAAACGLSLDTVRRAIRDGRLKAKRIGRQYVVLDTDLRDWLDSLDDA